MNRMVDSGPRSLLRWLYLGRTAVAAAVFLAALWTWAALGPDVTLAVTLLWGAVLGVTLVGFFYSHVARRRLTDHFLYAQVLFDALFVTAVVHLTGGPDSAFVPLYILVIAEAALLLPFLGGLLVALLVSALFAADTVLLSGGHLDWVTVLRLGLFAAVGVVTGHLGDRLRTANRARVDAEAALARTRLDTARLLASLGTGILTVDAAGRLLYLNPAGERLVGLSTAVWLGQPVLDELERRAPGFGAALRRTWDERRPMQRVATSPADPDGPVFEVTTALLEGEAVPAVAALFHDVREARRMEALQRRAEQLAAVAELGAGLAHEIRNPLAAVRSAVEQLVHDDLAAADRDVLRRVAVREADRIVRLLDEFLALARPGPGPRAPVAMASVLAAAMEAVRLHPDAAGVDFRAELDDPERLWVAGQREVLQRAFFNLILNGAQWAGRGGWVHVFACRRAGSAAAPVVEVRIADSGPGVPPEWRDRIFDPFVGRRAGGTGLGLALVQRAVDAHGGAVWVADAGPGATFVVELPALPPPD